MTADEDMRGGMTRITGDPAVSVAYLRIWCFSFGKDPGRSPDARGDESSTPGGGRGGGRDGGGAAVRRRVGRLGRDRGPCGRDRCHGGRPARADRDHRWRRDLSCRLLARRPSGVAAGAGLGPGRCRAGGACDRGVPGRAGHGCVPGASGREERLPAGDGHGARARAAGGLLRPGRARPGVRCPRRGPGHGVERACLATGGPGGSCRSSLRSRSACRRRRPRRPGRARSGSLRVGGG